MADKQQQGPPASTNSFTGGMNKDEVDLYKQANQWTHALNAARNLPDGGGGGLHTEPGNLFCCEFPYTLIGAIPLTEDQWMVFLTDDIVSEIGIFVEAQCTYTTLTGPQTCPGFNRKYPITGASRRGYDCGFDVYFTDGQTFDKFINTAKVPFVQIDTTPTGPCRTFVDTTVLDCEKMRIAPHFNIPCMKLAKSEGSGQLLNGSYQVAIRYAINSIPCTDFIALSPIIAIFAHGNLAGAIKLSVDGINEATKNIFTEMEVVLVSMINNQVEARRIGIYSTSQTVIYIDDIDQTLPIVPIELLPLVTPAIERSDSIYSVSQYLLRVGTRTKPDPNYQLLANQITAWWCCVQYNGQYYRRGGDSFGMNVGHMRDEVYAYYIRWIWNTGDKTADYSIPGLPAGTPATFNYGGPTSPDTGTTIAYGRFEGYSSTELYDDRHPSVWGPLCGLPIMHHKFPDQTLHPDLTHFITSGTGIGFSENIRCMGVFFDNIQLPVDNNGNVLQDIQGYEILRAVREGHKSVIAKGMVNSTRGYTDPYTGKTGIYQNYPYNDLTPDFYLTSDVNIINTGHPNTSSDPQHYNTDSPLSVVRGDIISFHSPDTVFTDPQLGTNGILTLVQELHGTATGYFQQAYRHGNFKTLTNFSTYLATLINVISTVSDLIAVTANAVTGGNPPDLSIASTQPIPLNIGLYYDNTYTNDVAGTDIAAALKIAGAVANIAMFIAMESLKFRTLQMQLITIIEGMVPARAFAWQWNSQGFYNNFSGIQGGSAVYTVDDYQYIKGHIQDFAGSTVNNLWRNTYVGMHLNGSVPLLSGDNTRQTMFQRGIRPQDNDSVMGPFTDKTSAHYGVYSVTQRAQYGQIDSTKQVPISCVQAVDVTFTGVYQSPILWGGDTYINRYTEKNPMFFFNDWLINAPPDFQYNYRNYVNLPYPRYWIDNSKIHVDFLGLASKLRFLDAQISDGGVSIFGVSFNTYVKNGAFYLFCNGVRDFYVESEVNVGYRDWEDVDSKRFYDPYGYTDIATMFRSDIIKSDILYKYDYSLSASRFFNQYLSWGKTLDRDYDPLLAYTCFTYYPRRVHYSLSQDLESRKDNWRIFLANNYKDFGSTVTAIKEIHKSGALILLKDQAPEQFIGSDVLETGAGVKVTVGDGGLFNQVLQSVSNADMSLQYGSCQNKMSIVNTPHGVFWVSRDTGKVFNYSGGAMSDITPGVKYWLARYLPSQLLQQFPSYPLPDSPIMGIGVQCIYDNTNEVLYICKKDYKLLPQWIGQVFLIGTDFYWLNPTAVSGFSKLLIQLTDPLYFEDCSWTLSRDCIKNEWISYHDWAPSYNIPAKTHFLTANSLVNNGASVWRHNLRTDLFCNYYNRQYAFELSYYAGIGTTETVLQTVSLILEAYQYRTNGVDRFQTYGTFFDKAVIFNPEQNSFMLDLTLRPWDDPYTALNFPAMTATSYNILYDKKENVYLFNQFNDFTNDRFQFGIGSLQAFSTAENGYSWSLVGPYFDLAKSWNSLKRFRYRGTQVWLRKTNPGSIAMTVIAAGTKNIISPR